MIPINSLNKTKTKAILEYLGTDRKVKFENLVILFEEMNALGYQSGVSLTKYDECISMSIYYKSINVFILSIWQDGLRIDLARRNETRTVPMKRIPIVEKIIRTNIFNEKSNHVKFEYSIGQNEKDIKNLMEILKQIANEFDSTLEKEYKKLSEKGSFYLNDIIVNNYKLYQHISLELSKNANLFIGDNGNGKTAFLEAVYQLISTFQSMFQESKNYNKNKINASEDIYFEIEEGELGLPFINRAEEALIKGDIFLNDNNYEISRVKRINGGGGGSGVNKELEQYIEQIDIANKYFDMPILPVFCFYETNRLLSKENSTRTVEKNRFDIYNSTKRWRNNISGVAQFLKDCFIEQEKYGKTIPAFVIIKSALEKAYSGLVKTEDENIDVELKYYFNMIVLRIGDKYITLEQMSDGYQAVLGIVADLAYRMIVLNPNTEDVLEKTPGLVLIDEIDLHLHPKWQKKFLGIIEDIFPKIQIIATTHSPFVIQSLKSDKDKLFILKGNNIEETAIVDYYGLEDAVYSYMGVENPVWSEYKKQDFISYSEFMTLFDRYFKQTNNDEKRNLADKMRISLKQNSINTEVYYGLKMKMDIIEELEKTRTNETS